LSKKVKVYLSFEEWGDKMSYVSMKEMLQDAKQKGYAVGAFNIVDYVTTYSAIKAAETRNSPIIIQTSTKTISLYGYKAVVGWVSTLAKNAKVPVALHLDHCKDLGIIQNCIEAGWTSVMIDASSLPFDKNIELTQNVVKMAYGKNISVEGELGAIVGVEDDIFINEQDAHLADPESCLKFIEATEVDVLAPAIGTAHGLYKKEPNVNFNLLSKISSMTNIPLAIHGGTGLSNEIFRKCILAGGAKINISTSIKHTFKNSLLAFWQQFPNNYEPIQAIKYLEEAIMKEVSLFMDVFGSSNKA
jgi:ketose-bisphosphate aldolase